MPIALTTPIQPTTETTIAITSCNIVLEPSTTITVFYAPVDGNGNPTLPATSLVLNATGIAAFGATGGGFKAKPYAALQAQVPALAGTVS